MKIMGYTFDDGVLAWKQDFDEVAMPYFQEGTGAHKKVGCIVTHGIGGTPANVRVVADELVRRGYTVFAPTIAGHGTSILDLSKSTWQDWLKSEEDAYQRLVDAGCDEIIPIGLSLGGILTGMIAEEKPCTCAVMMSPPVCMKRWLHYARFLSGLTRGVQYPEMKKEERAGKLPYSQMYNGFSPNALRELWKLILRLRRNFQDIACPVYAMWAELDDKVSLRARKVLKKGLAHVEYRETVVMGAAHGQSYDPNVRDEVARMVADYVDEKVDGQKA